MPATLERPTIVEIQTTPAPSTPPPEPPWRRPTSRSFFDRYQQHLWIGAVSLAVILVAVTPLVADVLSRRAGTPASSSAVQLVTITASEFKFVPSNVPVAAGQKVTFTLDNKGVVEHDLTIPATGFTLLAKAGQVAIIWAGWTKTLIFIVLAPLIGFVLGFVFMVAIFWIMRPFAPSRVDRYFRKLQLVSAAMYSLGHGANDAQKTMGIIAGALFAAGYLTEFRIPFWVEMAAYSAISLGTLSGGWRIIQTMGSKIPRLQPGGGFAPETAGAISLFTATSLGVPVSTTHTITGAIIGVGSTRRLSAVRWGIAGQIVWAWVLTIPAAAMIAAVMYYVLAFAGLK